MKEFKAGTLRSGSKNGPKVTSRQQALAIGLNDKGSKTGKLMASMVGGKSK